MTGAIGRALFVVTTIFSLVFSMSISVLAQEGAANANAQCTSGDYSCDWPTKRTVGTGQYATQVQCMRNKPCTETKSNTTGKCARFEFCTASGQTDKDLTGKPSGWTGEGDTQPSAPQIPSVPMSPAPAAPAPSTPSTQPPAADPTGAFKEPQKTPDPAKQVENKSLVERLRSFFTGTPTDGTSPDPSLPGTMHGFPDGSSSTLQPDSLPGEAEVKDYTDPIAQNSNSTFGPKTDSGSIAEAPWYERAWNSVTTALTPSESPPGQTEFGTMEGFPVQQADPHLTNDFGYGNPNQTEAYNYPASDDPRLPAHFDPQDPLFNSVGPEPTKTELTWLNDKAAADIRLAEKQIDLAKIEAEFRPLGDRATQLANEMERLAAGAQKTDKGLVFNTKDELKAYTDARKALQKMQPELQAASSRYGEAIADYNASVQAYNNEFFAAKYDAMGTAYYGPGAAESAMLADRMGDYRASGGKFYDAFGGSYATPSEALQADRFLLKNAELANQYQAQQTVVDQFKNNTSWFARTFGSETRGELLREEGKLAQLKDAMTTNTAVANYLAKGVESELFAERLNADPKTPQEVAARSLLYGQVRDWDQNSSLAETMRTASTRDLQLMGYLPMEGQDVTREDLIKHFQFRSDLSAGRIAELTGQKEMTPQTLWSIATLTKSPADFEAFNRAYLDVTETPTAMMILGEDRYHKWAGEVLAFGQTSIDSFVSKAYKDASEKLSLTTPRQWFPGAASLLAGSIVGNVGEFVGLPTTQRSIEMLSQTPGEIAFSRGISGPMALLDMTTLSAPKFAFTGMSLALRETSLAAGEFRFGAGLTEGLSGMEARVAARYAQTVETNISGQVARGELNAAAAQRAAYSDLYEQIARSDPGRTGQVDNLMASLRTRMEALDITPPGGYRPQGATVADTAADVARAPEPVVTPAPGSPSNVTNIPRAEAPITNPTTVSPVTNTVRDTAAAVAREAVVAEALAEKAVIAQQAAAARTYEEAFAARAKADEIQTKLNTQIARELESMAAQNVVRETDALRQLRQATAEIQNLQTDLAKTMAREAISSPPNISRSPYNEVVLSNRFGPLGRAQALAANVFAETALSVRNAFATPAQSLRTAFAAFQIQVGGIEAGNAGSNALESLVRASANRNAATLTPDSAPVANPGQTGTSPVLSRIPDAVAPIVNTAIPLSRFDATDILGNVNPFAQPTVIQNARGVGLTSEIPSAQQSFITYENGKVVFNVRTLSEAVPSGTSYSIDLANLRVSAARTVPETFVPNAAPAQVTPGTAVTTPAPTQAAPVTTARYGVPNFFTNGILNAPGEAAKFVWNSINPISSARAATPPVAGEIALPAAPNGSPVSARTTFYGPGAGGTMQGGWETSRPNLEGLKNERGAPIPRTLDDVRLGKAGYVSLAVDPSNYGKFYNLGPVTYRSVLDKKIYTGDKLAAEASLKKADTNLHMTYAPQLEKVIGYAHDTGGAFMGRPDKFDVAVGDFRGWTDNAAMRFLTSSGQEYGGNKLNAWQQINPVQARQYIAAVTAKPPAAVAEMTPKPAATKPVVETVRAANTATLPIVKKFTDRFTQNLSQPMQSIRAALTPRSVAPNPVPAAIIPQTPQQAPQALASAPRRLAEGGNKEFEAYTDLSVVVGRDTLMRQGYIFVPANIDASKPVTIVMYMHGQLENGRSINAFSDTIQRQQLAQQIRDSRMNAVLVAPNMDAIPAASGYFTRSGETAKFLSAAENQFAQTIGIPKESLQNSPVVLVTYSGGYYPAGKMLASGELNQRLSAIFMLDSGYGTEAKGFLNGVKKWSQANPSGIVVSGYTVSTKAGNDALTNLFRNQRTGVLTRTIVTSPLPAGEVIKPGTFAQIRTQGTAAEPHRNYVTNAGLTTAGVQPPIATILQMLPSVSNPATPLVAQTKVPQVVKTMAERSIFAQPKSAAVQSHLGQVMAPTEAWMNARGREIVDAMGGSNGMLRPYTYDAAGVVRDLATGKVLEGFSFKPAGSAAARLDQFAKINGKVTNYKYNVVDGRLVALNELVRRSLGLQQLEFMSGVRPLDIGSNRHHTVVKGPDGTNMLITYAIDYAGGNTTIKAAIAAAASRAQTSLNAATGGKPFVPLSIGAQYPNTPNMVHMDVNPRPEARTWGGGQTSPLLSSIISFVARGSNTAENPVTHAVFAEALKQARLGISPTNPMVAIGGPTAPQVRQAPAIVAEAPDASLPTRPASQPSGMTERFTARITANGERVAEAATAMVKGAYENIRTALTPKTAPAPEVAVNADGDIRVTSPSTPNTHEMPTGVAPNPVTPAQPTTPAVTPPAAQPAPVVTQPAAPVPTTPASTPVNADGDVRVTSPSTPNTHEMPPVAVVDSVPATQPVASARVPLQEQLTTAASRAVEATRGWFDRSQKEFARLTEQLRARSAVQQSPRQAPNTIIGSDGDVIPVGQASPNTHEMPTGVSAATPATAQPAPRAAADVASGVRNELTQTQRALQEAARVKAEIAGKKQSDIAKIPTEPKVVKLPTAKVTESAQKAVTREAPKPAYYPNPEALNAVTRLTAATNELNKATANLASAFQRMRAGSTDVKPVTNAMGQLSQARRNVQIAFNDAVRAKAFSSSDIGSIRDGIVAVNRIGKEIEGYRSYSSFLSPDLVNSYWHQIAVMSQTGTAAVKNLAAKITGAKVVTPAIQTPKEVAPSTVLPAPAVSPAPTTPVAAATDGSGFSLPKFISNIRENDVARPFFDTGVVLGAAGIALKATDVTAKVLKKATTAIANTWKTAFPRTATAPATPAAPARPATPTAPSPAPAAPTTPSPSSPTPRAVLPSLGAMRSAASRASAALAPVARAAGVRAVAGTSAATKTVRNWVSARLSRSSSTGTYAATPANPILRINPTNGRFEFIPPTTAGAAPTASLPGRFIQGTWGAAKWCVSGFGKFAACALGGGIGYAILDAGVYAVSGGSSAPTGTTPPPKNPNTLANPGTQQPGTQPPGTQAPGSPGTTPGGETTDSGLGGLGSLGSLANIAKSLPQLMQNLKNLFNPQKNSQPTTPTNIPIVKLDANPMTVVSGTTTRLSWSGENIASCTVIGPGSATLTRGGASGVITSPALATSTEFAVICPGTDGVSATNSTVTVSVDGSTAPTIPVILPPGVTKNASYSTAFNNPTGTNGSGTGAGTGSGNTTGSNGNNEAPVTPKTSGVDQYGNKVSAWCDPNQPIDSYTTCLCNLEPTGCYPWRQRQQ